MTSILAPMCMACARFRRDAPAVLGLTCDAYPGGIPDEIIEGDWDHRVSKPGDHGLLYDPKPGAPVMPYWPDERGDRS
jgi:hypothetical protein